MRDYEAAKVLLERLGAAGVIEMAMREQEVFDLLRFDPGGPDVIQQPNLGASTPGIHQRRVSFEVDQVDRGIFWRRQSAAADLMYLVGDLHLRISDRTVARYVVKLTVQG
jgi:hypothetical protein